MSYIFYLNGTPFENPQEDRDLRSSLKRNQNFNSILYTQDAEVTFTGEAFDYLYNLYWSGLCEEVDVEIWEDLGNESLFLYDGVIKISDARIDYQKEGVAVKIEDRAFFSYINNNKSVEVVIGPETLSKSGEAITQLPLYKANFFNPCANTYDAQPNVPGYLLIDVLQFICDYITDDRITVQSDLLSGDGDEYPLFLCQGRSMRPGLNFPEMEEVKLSFETVYEFIQKTYNTAFRIESPFGYYGKAVLRIEKQDFFYSEDAGLSLEDVKDLEISADTKELFSSVKFGSEADTDLVTQGADCATGINNTHTQVDEPLYGWSPNEFHLSGQCNEDNLLDLSHDFQIASNVIEDVNQLASPDFDDDLFLVEVKDIDEALQTCVAVNHEFYGTAPPYYYNMGINNEQVLLRHSGYIHQDIKNYLEGSADQFRATNGLQVFNSTGNCVNTIPGIPPGSFCENEHIMEYDDVTSPGNFNNGGNYDTVTWKYTCPDDGDYTFDHTVFFVKNNLSPTSSGQLRAIQGRVRITNQTKGTIIAQSNLETYTTNGSETMSISTTTPCDAGDEIVASIVLIFIKGPISQTPFGISVTSDSYFSCTGTPEAGGNIQAQNTTEFKAILFKFEYPLTGGEFQQLVDDPTQLITITSNEKTFRGWIDRIDYENWRGTADITLRANAIIQDTESTVIS